MWDTETGRDLASLPVSGGLVYGVAFSPDGTRLVSGGQDLDVTVWDAVTLQPLRRFRGHTAWVRGVAFAPDGRHVLSVSYDGSVKVWDTHGPE